MKTIITGLVVALLISFVPGASAASNESVPLGENSDQPIDITSRKVTARIVPGGKELVFEGSVKARQETLNLSCDRLIVVYDEKKKTKEDPESRGKKIGKDWQDASVLKSATASGNVKVVKNDLTAVSGKAVYDSGKRTVTLTEGPPRVWQGQDVVLAHTIVIYLNENRLELLGGDENIKATINPSRQKKEKEK